MFPGGRHWLIDCGRERDGKRTLCPYLWSKGIVSIDRIVITSEDKRHYGGLDAVTDNFATAGTVRPDSVTKQEQYFVNGGTVTIVPFSTKQGASLSVRIDYAGKRVAFVQQENLAGDRSCAASDVLNVSCHGKELYAMSSIRPLKARSIILSGTVPKDTPDMEGVYPLKKCGAVSCVVTSQGIRVKEFIEAKYSADTYDDE